jgi:uncharacterized membrane protein
MQLDSNIISTLLVFLAGQTIALIFYAGVVCAMLRNHDKRLDKTEATLTKFAVIAAQLAAKQGIQIS